MRFEVIQQQRMILLSGKANTPAAEYASNLETIGQIEAVTVEEAMTAAKTLKEFRYGRGLAKFPILQEITGVH